ncbi:MAG: type II CAAX prenyl endopeptidase Rce1 family protein [Thermoplasmata archaeon]
MGARVLLGVFWTGAIFLFFGYLLAIFMSLLRIGPGIMAGIAEEACANCTTLLFLVNPLSPTLITELVELAGQESLVWFFLLWASIFFLASYLLLFHARPAYRAIRLPLDHAGEKTRSNSLFVAVGQLFMAVLLFDFIYFVLILPFGIGIEPRPPVSSENFPLWYVFYSLITAAVWEEVATRLVLIGVPMTLGSLAMRLVHTLPAAAGRRGVAGRYAAGSVRYLLGGQVHARSPTVAKLAGAALVLLSAAIFGYLHVPAWGAWKFVDTLVLGLALGYLFLRYGLGASVVLHLSVNFLAILQYLSGSGVIFFTIFYLVLVALGAGFALHYLRESRRFVHDSFRALG